jgi:hypothetical protein
MRLAGAWKSDHENALGRPPTKALELLGILQKLDDLLELGFGLLNAGDILKRGLVRVFSKDLRTAFAE